MSHKKSLIYQSIYIYIKSDILYYLGLDILYINNNTKPV